MILLSLTTLANSIAITYVSFYVNAVRVLITSELFQFLAITSILYSNLVINIYFMQSLKLLYRSGLKINYFSTANCTNIQPAYCLVVTVLL
jgi:hypothetical protein